MAVRINDTLYAKLPTLTGTVASLTATKGSLVAADTTNAKLVAVTGSVGTTQTLIGVLTKAVASTDTQCEYKPLNSGIYCIVDCTNNTAANQLYKRQAMTDASTVANTSTDITTNLGVFMPLKQVGAASDKKLYGYFVTLGQTT
jgi:hypothetical protein